MEASWDFFYNWAQWLSDEPFRRHELWILSPYWQFRCRVTSVAYDGV